MQLWDARGPILETSLQELGTWGFSLPRLPTAYHYSQIFQTRKYLDSLPIYMIVLTF